MARVAKKKEEAVSLETVLWNCRVALRGVGSTDKNRDAVIGLCFLKFAGDKFEKRRAELIAQYGDIPAFLEKASFYNAVNVFYLKETARWAYIVKNAGANDIAVILDQAMADIEESNPALKGALSLNLYATLGAPKEKIKQLIDEVNKIDESRFHEEDLIGRVYEYFLQVYAASGTKEDGEFYTPACVVQLIAEMIEQSPYSDELRKEEATLLLAGIMLDTKNFTHSTGAQTFSAVHYLYEKGAHTNVTRLFFYETLDEMITASDFGSRTRIYRGRVAITWLNTDNTRAEKINERVAAAKAADRLLTVRGIDASFALVSIGNSVSISARSGDAINVQIIMEKLGGGGHFDMAGAQIKDTSLTYACELLKGAIDDYLDNEEAERK